MKIKTFEKLLRELELNGRKMWEDGLKELVAKGKYKPGDTVGKSYIEWKIEVILTAVKDIEF